MTRCKKLHPVAFYFLEGFLLTVYVVYLDESGNPGSFRNSQDHFVIGGIAVHEGQIRQLSDRLDDIQSRFFTSVGIPRKRSSSLTVPMKQKVSIAP